MSGWLLGGAAAWAEDPPDPPPPAGAGAVGETPAEAIPEEEAAPVEPAPVEAAPESDPAARIEELEQRLRILERREEVAAEIAAEKAKTGATASAGRDGFSIRSADGTVGFRVRGYVQADYQGFTHDEDLPAIDTFLLRRVRPVFEGSVGKYFEFRVMPEFDSGGTMSLQDGYADWKFTRATRLRVGKMKSPVGLERLQGAPDLLFIVRMAPTNLAPNRDVGLLMHGEPWDGLFIWDAALLNGVPDGGSADLDSGDGKDGAARLFVLPWKRTAIGALQGLGFGVAGTYGRNEGLPRSTGLASYKTPGNLDFFVWRSDGATAAATVVADGKRTRVVPQLYWAAGRFGLLTEYARVHQEVTLGATTDEVISEAWGATVSFLLTDDATSFRGVTPKRGFDPGAGQWGAFEVVARASALRVSDNAFPTFADPARSARVSRDVGVGFNWYLSRNFRIMVDYIETHFDGGAAAGADRPEEDLILTRFQVAW